MSAFVRQLVVLSVLWSFCELLLPDGKQQRMVRFTVSVLVMTALLSALNGLLGNAAGVDWPAQAVLAQGTEPEGERIALVAVANQAQSYCERVAGRAGYEAKGAVYLRPNGVVDSIQLRLKPKDGASPLVDGEELKRRLTQTLGIDGTALQLFMEEAQSEAGES